MTRFRLASLSLLLVLAMASIALANPGLLQRGSYLIKLTKTIEGQNFSQPTLSYFLCMGGKLLIFNSANPSRTCEVTRFDIESNRINWGIRCGKWGEYIYNEGSTLYNGTYFEGSTVLYTDDPSVPKETHHFNGTLAGPCQ